MTSSGSGAAGLRLLQCLRAAGAGTVVCGQPPQQPQPWFKRLGRKQAQHGPLYAEIVADGADQVGDPAGVVGVVEGLQPALSSASEAISGTGTRWVRGFTTAVDWLLVGAAEELAATLTRCSLLNRLSVCYSSLGHTLPAGRRR